MARIVVTGGCGFIGSHLVKRLKELGHIVYIVDLNYEPEPIDLTSYVDTKRHLEEISDYLTKSIDVVFDLATLSLPLSLVEPYKVVYKIFCMGTVLCELARENYFKTLIHISSSEVFNITTPYAATKDAQDKLILSYVNSFGIDAKIVRPFNTYGEGQDLGAIIPNTIKRILKRKRPIITGDGNQGRDLIYVDDVVREIIWVWKKGRSGEEYNLTTGECYSINYIVRQISNLMNYKGKPKYLPARQGDTYNIHGRQTVFKFIDLDTGLKKTIKWWKKQDFTL